MNAPFSQQDRQGRLSTPLGPDTLVLLRMDGTEELSGDFEWRVEALATEGGLDLEALLGTHATVEIYHATGTRTFDGIVCEAEHRGKVENGWRYDLVLRPWLHVAGLRRNMRIFHNKTVVQIVEETLSAYSGLGNPHLDVQLTSDYPVLEYTVQYGESDADFVSRQLERFGITWSWRHEVASHTLLLTDMELNLPEVPGGTRPYFGVEGYHRAEEEHFSLWSSAKRITTGAVRMTEYNFKTPNAAQEVDQTGDAEHPSGDIESYDWPGDYLDMGEGGGVVHRRLQAERGQAPRHQAEGDVISLGAGWRVTLAGDDVPGATGRTFVCLKAQHSFRAQAYGSGDAGNDETPYEGAYVLTPDDTPYRPERRLRGPRVDGPETAVVVGEGEIDCDEHGRILVRFHWDRDDAYTMRVRVSQNWASKGWGGMVIPRIGMEVIVEHLRGDPDKPIVTGCVYNGRNVPPYDLPQHKTRSTFKTDTHQAAYDGFNELRFEDQRYKEEVYLRAQKDLSVKVQNDETRIIDDNSVQFVGEALVSIVGQDRFSETNGRTIDYVGPPKHPAVGVRAARKVTDQLNKFAEGVVDLAKAAGKWSVTTFVKGNRSTTIGGDETKQVGGKYGKQIDGTYNVNVKSNIDLHTMRTLRLEAAKHLELTAGSSITLSCGQGRLVMKKDGSVRIFGSDIDVVAENSVEVDGGRIVQIDTPASSLDISDSKVSISSKRIDLN